MGVALLPVLVRELHAKRIERANHQQELALSFSLFASFLIMTALVMLSGVFVKIVFEHGKFTSSDAFQTARALSAYALGLPAYIMIKILSARFFARGRVLFPLLCGLGSVFVDIVLSLILIRFFGHVGIALATSISAWTNVVLLLFFLWQKREWKPSWQLGGVFVKVVALSLMIILAFSPICERVNVASLDKWSSLTYAISGGFFIMMLFALGGYLFCGTYVRNAFSAHFLNPSKKI